MIATLIDEQGMVRGRCGGWEHFPRTAALMVPVARLQSDDTTLKYLKELSGMFIGYETLSATRIGRSVAALCERSRDRHVRDACQRLVARWRSTATRGLRRRRRIAHKRTWESVRIDHMKEMQQRRKGTQAQAHAGRGGVTAAAEPAADDRTTTAAAGGGDTGERARGAPQPGTRRTWLHPPPRQTRAEDGEGETVLESDDEGGGDTREGREGEA